MVIFHSYVSLPEGKVIPVFWWYTYLGEETLRNSDDIVGFNQENMRAYCG